MEIPTHTYIVDPETIAFSFHGNFDEIKSYFKEIPILPIFDWLQVITNKLGLACERLCSFYFEVWFLTEGRGHLSDVSEEWSGIIIFKF